jgi:NADH dehydrogenase
VRTNKGDIEFKYCITALGSHVNFHKIPGAQKFSHHVRTLEAAVKLHKTFTKKLEEQKEIAINIVGGGATGVEMAGQFGDLKNHEIRKLYPDTKININLIQNSDKIIAYSSKETQKSVKRKLEEYKVNITFNSLVKEVTKDKIVLANDKVIKSDLTIWTAGFYCNGHELINSTVNGGRLVVNEFLQTNKHHNIFAIGDMSFVKQGKEDQCGYPQTGEIAYQQGKTAAKNLIKLIENEHLEPFTYESKGMLIPVGDWYAAAEVKNVKFTGRFAWWLRRTVYLISMPGLVRKLRIVSDWTLNAFGMKRVSEE